MNNFNLNWMFNPPPLFGMGMSNRNSGQNAVPASEEHMHEEDAAESVGCPQITLRSRKPQGFAGSRDCRTFQESAAKRVHRNRGENRDRRGVRVSEERQDRRDREESRDRQAVRASAAKRVRRELRDRRDHRGSADRWGPKEKPANVVRWVLPAIRRTAYLPLFRERGCPCRSTPVCR